MLLIDDLGPRRFASEYLSRQIELLNDLRMNTAMVQAFYEFLHGLRQQQGSLFVYGNGGSNAIASHIAVDYTKQGGLKTYSFNDVSTLSCYANDFGWDQAVARGITMSPCKPDAVMLISSSGSSINVVNAAKHCRANNIPLLSMTGFDDANPLKGLSDLSYWVDSKAYNVIENTHQVFALLICDLLKGIDEYPAS